MDDREGERVGVARWVMTDKEVMQMALDALEDVADGAEESHKTVAAIEALRTRLSQCERCGEANPAEIHTCTPKREWQGLTDEEIREFEIWLDDEEEKHGWNLPADIVKYIEAKLKEKNT